MGLFCGTTVPGGSGGGTGTPPIPYLGECCWDPLPADDAAEIPPLDGEPKPRPIDPEAGPTGIRGGLNLSRGTTVPGGSGGGGGMLAMVTTGFYQQEWKASLRFPTRYSTVVG